MVLLKSVLGNKLQLGSNGIFVQLAKLAYVQLKIEVRQGLEMVQEAVAWPTPKLEIAADLFSLKKFRGKFVRI